MSKPIIEVQKISKSYIIGERAPYLTMSDFVHSAVRKIRHITNQSRRVGIERIWALKDVNFSVEPGEIMGIIGRNGAGKSTILKILSEITYPTSGEVYLRGRVGESA